MIRLDAVGNPTSSVSPRRTGILNVVLLSLLIALSGCATTSSHRDGESSNADSSAVATALDSFLTAFENLEWDRFCSFFADDACVFFPSAATPQKFCGRDAVEERFKTEFEAIRAGAEAGPPYMNLEPDALSITPLVDGAVLVAFELRNAVRHGRRSIVFGKGTGGWQIVHLHASNVPWPDEPTPR